MTGLLLQWKGMKTVIILKKSAFPSLWLKKTTFHLAVSKMPLYNHHDHVFLT